MVSFLFIACLILAAFIILIAVHIFVLPVRIAARLRTERNNFFTAYLRWGIIRASVNISGVETATLYLYSFRVREFPLERDVPSGEEEEGFEAGKTRPVAGRIFVIIKEIGFDYLRMNAKIGLGDPCDTGIIFGYVSALKGIVQSSDRFRLDVRPVFETEAFELDLEAGFLIKKPYRVLTGIIGIFRDSRNKPAKSAGAESAV